MALLRVYQYPLGSFPAKAHVKKVSTENTSHNASKEMQKKGKTTLRVCCTLLWRDTPREPTGLEYVQKRAHAGQACSPATWAVAGRQHKPTPPKTPIKRGGGRVLTTFSKHASKTKNKKSIGHQEAQRPKTKIDNATTNNRQREHR